MSKFELGATVYACPNSPTGYMVHFEYDCKEEDVKTVSVSVPCACLDPNLDVQDPNNFYSPWDYKPGMYVSAMAPGSGKWGYVVEMEKDPETGYYVAEFPIPSGSFAYSYIMEWDATEEEKAAYTGFPGREPWRKRSDDPANPSPAKKNPDSLHKTGDLFNSIVYGKYDPEKQAGSLNMDYVLPAEGPTGKLEYLAYDGVLPEKQYVGVYTPAGYDPNRAEPYKVVYMSHGGGGNETDWFAMGHLDNIVDNLGADIMVVTMDNSIHKWNFEVIEDNVINYIIPFIEKNYNVSKDAKDRAFGGLSMGCMTTFHMFYDHPEAFGYFGGFSGPDCSAIKDTPGIDKPLLYFTVGTCDIASEHVTPNRPGQKIKYEDYQRYLAENPMPNVVDGGYLWGAHDWHVWSQSFYTFVKDYAFK